MLGGLIGYFLVGHLRWEILLSLYLVPVFYYGIVVLKNPFPVSEARAAGVKIGQMLGTLVDFADPANEKPRQ